MQSTKIHKICFKCFYPSIFNLNCNWILKPVNLTFNIRKNIYYHRICGTFLFFDIQLKLRKRQNWRLFHWQIPIIFIFLYNWNQVHNNHKCRLVGPTVAHFAGINWYKAHLQINSVCCLYTFCAFRVSLNLNSKVNSRN